MFCCENCVAGGAPPAGGGGKYWPVPASWATGAYTGYVLLGGETGEGMEGWPASFWTLVDNGRRCIPNPGF
jgi:hypothetical protein